MQVLQQLWHMSTKQVYRMMHDTVFWLGTVLVAIGQRAPHPVCHESWSTLSWQYWLRIELTMQEMLISAQNWGFFDNCAQPSLFIVKTQTQSQPRLQWMMRFINYLGCILMWDWLWVIPWDCQLLLGSFTWYHFHRWSQDNSDNAISLLIVHHSWRM